MRLFILFSILFVILFNIIKPYGPDFGSAIQNFVNYSSCKQVKTYRIGNIDPAFNINEDELKVLSQVAVNVWNKTVNTELLRYDEKGQIVLNLTYDKKQEFSTEINQKQSALDLSKNALDSRQRQFEQDVNVFESRMLDFKNEVDEWNRKGGAPPQVYERLIQDQNELKTEADRLNQEATKLNYTAKQFNSEVGKLNNVIDNFNQELSLRPEEGLYTGSEKRIDIFFITNKDEFLHTLIHEFGHALDLPHIDSEKAIMYPYTTEILEPSRLDIDAIVEVCREKNIIERVVTNSQLLLDLVLSKS